MQYYDAFFSEQQLKIIIPLCTIDLLALSVPKTKKHLGVNIFFKHHILVRSRMELLRIEGGKKVGKPSLYCGSILPVVVSLNRQELPRDLCLSLILACCTKGRNIFPLPHEIFFSSV